MVHLRQASTSEHCTRDTTSKLQVKIPGGKPDKDTTDGSSDAVEADEMEQQGRNKTRVDNGVEQGKSYTVYRHRLHANALQTNRLYQCMHHGFRTPPMVYSPGNASCSVRG